LVDWNQLEDATWSVLSALSRFGSRVDTDSLLQLANQQLPEWRDTSDVVAQSYRALEVLDQLRLAAKPDGVTRELTELGRDLLSNTSSPRALNFAENPQLAEWALREDVSAASWQVSVSDENTFRRLEVSDWRQFGEVDINFHPQLTLISGANGSGGRRVRGRAPRVVHGRRRQHGAARRSVRVRRRQHRRLRLLTLVN